MVIKEFNIANFKCIKCGKCCFLNYLALTREDYKRLKSHLPKGMILTDYYSPFPFLLKIKGRCIFLRKGNLCKIYSLRPITCRLFPLSLGFLPDGSLVVNLRRCDGVGLKTGKTIDNSFIEQLISEISEISPKFLSILKKAEVAKYGGFIPFYSWDEYTDFHGKRKILRFLTKLMSSDILSINDPKIRINATSELILNKLENYLEPLRSLYRDKLLLTNGDLKNIMEYLNERFEIGIRKVVEDRLHYLENTEKKFREIGRAKIFWEGKPIDVKLDGELKFDYFGQQGRIKVADLAFKKNYLPEAERLILEYITELTERVGLGGLPIHEPLQKISTILNRFSIDIDFYCKYHSFGKNEVNEESARRAISDLDVLLPIYL